ncbi:hypothetical protein FDZ71_00470 [bacterium]|nr:MAG: hypothetical protein FDZ71_00470 [bacterium]
MKEVLEKYKGKVRLAVKFAPYPYRDNAKMAAVAALAAKEQGAFAAMHEKLLDNYYQLDAKTIKKLAGELKLDIARFEGDLKNEKLIKKVEDDTALARKMEIWQTPTFIVNGELMVGERPIEHFIKVIDKELGIKDRK